MKFTSSIAAALAVAGASGAQLKAATGETIEGEYIVSALVSVSIDIPSPRSTRARLVTKSSRARAFRALVSLPLPFDSHGRSLNQRRS